MQILLMGFPLVEILIMNDMLGIYRYASYKPRYMYIQNRITIFVSGVG